MLFKIEKDYLVDAGEVLAATDGSRDLMQQAETSELSVGFGFGGFAVGDVAQDGGGADDFAEVVTHRSSGYGNIDSRSVPANSHCFDVSDSLALREPFENGHFLGTALDGDEHHHGFAEGLL